MARNTGPFKITIQGSGESRNGSFNDANNMAARFVNDLQNLGHVIESATFESPDSVDRMTVGRKAVPAVPPPAPPKVRKPQPVALDDVGHGLEFVLAENADEGKDSVDVQGLDVA
jgi:hypothetical protein